MGTPNIFLETFDHTTTRSLIFGERNETEIRTNGRTYVICDLSIGADLQTRREINENSSVRNEN